MLRRYSRIWSPALHREMDVLAFGHYGPPVVAVASAFGKFYDWENFGMVDAVGDLLDAGRMKLYCISTVDDESWLSDHWDFNRRCYMQRAFESFVVDNLAEAIRFDCRNPWQRIAVTGCSWGAYHAANLCLKYPHVYNYALCMSGRYDLGRALSDPRYNEDCFYADPMAYTQGFWGGHLDWVRANAHVNLVVGQGAHENNCIPETHRLADILAAKGISHERNIWGHDVEHHWYWWRRQLSNYLHRSLG